MARHGTMLSMHQPIVVPESDSSFGRGGGGGGGGGGEMRSREEEAAQ